MKFVILLLLVHFCDTAWIFITVNPVNDPPVADNDTTQTNEDTPVTLNALLDDTDPDGDLNGDSLTILTPPVNGLALDNGDSTVTYTPDANFFGIDSIQYEICDTSSLGSLCDTAWIFITVNPVNDPPVADDEVASTPEETPITIGVTDGDIDPDGQIDSTTVALVDSTANGSVSIDPVTGDITYTPNPDFNGMDTLTYEVCDNGSPVLCDTAQVIITVGPVNDPPVADNDTTMTNEDTPVTLNALLDDTDPDGDLHGDSLTILTPPVNGLALDNGDSTVTYTPDANFFGIDSIQYEICDTSALGSLCDTAWIFITVNPVNDPPVADDEVASTPEETPITIGVTDGDIDPDGQIDSTTVALVDSTANGSVSIDPVTGDITYTPNPDFNGMDTLTYEVCDNGSPVLCDTAQVIITVGPVNDPPIADNDTTQTNEDTPVTLNALLDDYDIDGDLNGDSLTILTPPTNGIAL